MLKNFAIDSFAKEKYFFHNLIKSLEFIEAKKNETNNCIEHANCFHCYSRNIVKKTSEKTLLHRDSNAHCGAVCSLAKGCNG